jgi:hypothetical protein
VWGLVKNFWFLPTMGLHAQGPRTGFKYMLPSERKQSPTIRDTFHGQNGLTSSSKGEFLVQIPCFGPRPGRLSVRIEIGLEHIQDRFKVENGLPRSLEFYYITIGLKDNFCFSPEIGILETAVMLMKEVPG